MERFTHENIFRPDPEKYKNRRQSCAGHEVILGFLRGEYTWDESQVKNSVLISQTADQYSVKNLPIAPSSLSQYVNQRLAGSIQRSKEYHGALRRFLNEYTKTNQENNANQVLLCVARSKILDCKIQVDMSLINIEIEKLKNNKRMDQENIMRFFTAADKDSDEMHAERMS